MRVLLVSVGTDGDIFPYAALGATLRARGHAATLVASANYRPLASRHGLGFAALVSEEENRELFEHPDFWNPIKTAPLMARWGVRFLRRQYDLLASLATPGTVLVANPGVLAALLAREKLGLPWVNLALQPWIIPSSIAPPLLPNFTWLARAPRPVWKVFWRFLNLVVDRLVGGGFNAVRADLGLKPMRRVFQNWLSTELVVGMFPAWYGPPPADWPAQVRLAGFPLFDGGWHEALPPEVARFCASGPPPVAFTFGTGMAHSADLFRAALEACATLGARAILLTKYRRELPQSLPPTVLHCAFAPFGKLFPKCAAVVHHGGIGTVASALAAGVPQLIHPLCFDQIDNAARVRKLGAGDCVRSRRLGGGQIAAALKRLLTGERRLAARQVAERFAGVDALAAAADLIEEFGSRRNMPEPS